jgi:hypothetical protein
LSRTCALAWTCSTSAVVGVLTAPSMREVIQREGWVTRAEFDAMIAALDRWADRPDAFLSWLYCGALGWVP